MVNTSEDVSFFKSSYTLSLPCLEGPHLGLQGLHLLLQLREPLLDAMKAMDFSAEGLVPYTRQRVVDVRGVCVIKAERHEVFDAETGYVRDIECWCCVNETSP